MWPKGPTRWKQGRTLYMSIPFTWDLPEARHYLMQHHAFWDRAVVGGPAVELMHDYLAGIPHVELGHHYDGVLQIVNPEATRTTTGCVRKCGFCAIGTGKIERGGFRELDSWPNLPLVCDNNILASSNEHFDLVLDGQEQLTGTDFNQGLDSRLLNEHHAERFARLRKPYLRLALDNVRYADQWIRAYETLLEAGCRKSHISCYALIGFDSDPSEAWERCEWINKLCTCLPMWFHPLDALECNTVTEQQRELGWTNKERIRIMRRFYKASVGGYTEN